MVTAVATVGVYCPQTGETVYRQAWLHGGPFDSAHDVVARLVASLSSGAADRVELVDERTSRTPRETNWSQLPLW